MSSFVPFLLGITSRFGRFVIYSSRLSALTRIWGDVIPHSTPACRQTDLSPVSPSGITRFISCESLLFQLSIILRITKEHSFSDGQDFPHIMCIEQALKCSFLRNCIFLHGWFSLNNSPAVFPPFPVHLPPLELPQHQLLLAVDVIILLFPPTSVTSFVKKQTRSSTGNPSHPSYSALTQTRLKTFQ